MIRPLVTAIVLAAGGSTRFGRPKLLEPLPAYQGRPMVSVVVDTVLTVGFHQVIVVVGSHAREVTEALAGRPVDIVVNSRWSQGLSTSLHAGLDHVDPRSEAALFVLADQPAITPHVIRSLVEAYQATGALIVVPTYRGRLGNPRLFSRRTFDDLRQVTGDEGGRSVLKSGRFEVVQVEVDQDAILVDVDQPEDLHHLTVDLMKRCERYKDREQTDDYG